MTRCQFDDSSDVELLFYGELDAETGARVRAHARGCEACRQRLEDLHAIRQALAAQPVVDAPPAGDWSGFMRRLDDRLTEGLRPSDSPTRSLARRFDGSLRFRLRQGYGGRAEAPSARRRARGSLTAFARVAAIAAMLAIVTFGIVIAARFRAVVPEQRVQTQPPNVAPHEQPQRAEAKPVVRALRENSAEHLERSKLVVLGLATRDAQHTAAGDWQYERQLAGTLLSDTRLYRLAAQERGVPDVARVMRDLETVLLEASMSENADRDTLERVQRLIVKRDLVAKIQTVAATGAAGL